MRWLAALWQQYHYPPLPAEPPPAPLPSVPPPPGLGALHHCGHPHASYATSPRTYRRRCLPCHQQQFTER